MQILFWSPLNISAKCHQNTSLPRYSFELPFQIWCFFSDTQFICLARYMLSPVHPSVCLSARPSVTLVDESTRIEGVARIASLHILGSGDVIGHVTIW